MVEIGGGPCAVAVVVGAVAVVVDCGANGGWWLDELFWSLSIAA